MSPGSSTSCFSRVFGLGLESNRPIAGLVQNSGTADVRLSFGDWPRDVRALTTPEAPPSYISPFADSAGVPLARGWDLPDGSRHLLANAGYEALIDRTGSAVWISGRATPGDDLDAWVLGPVLALVLRRRGTVCLHAAAVTTRGGAVVVAGGQGAGKSMLATLCAMRGCSVVTDDLAALDVSDECGPMAVHPGAAYVRTRPGTIEAIAEDLGRKADLRPSPDRQYLDLNLCDPPYALESRAVPVRAVYILDRGLAGGAGESIEPLRGAAAVIALAGDAWAARWLSHRERAVELDVLSRLVRDVPIWRVRPAPDAASWLALADAVLHGRDGSCA